MVPATSIKLSAFNHQNLPFEEATDNQKFSCEVTINPCFQETSPADMQIRRPNSLLLSKRKTTAAPPTRHHQEVKEVCDGSQHPELLLFPDSSITKRFKPIPDKTEKCGGVRIYFTENGKPIIRQISTSGSGRAVAALLAHEHGKEISRDRLDSDDMNVHEELKSYYELPCKMEKIESLADLSDAIDQNGVAAVMVRHKDSMPCWVIVDNIHLETGSIHCRNTHNCEGLELKTQAFFDMWCTEQNVIQIQRKERLI